MIISKNLNSLKHQNKAEFKNLDDSEFLSIGFSSLCDLCSLLDLTSLCNLNGLYSLKCLFFTKKLPGPDGWIIPGTKMTNTVPLLWNNSSKIQIFTDILYTFCRGLLRPADVTFF